MTDYQENPAPLAVTANQVEAGGYQNPAGNDSGVQGRPPWSAQAERPGSGLGEQAAARPADEPEPKGAENIGPEQGRPEQADDYGLNELAAQGGQVNPVLLEHMSSSMRQLGLDGHQAQGLVRAYQEAAACCREETRQKQADEVQKLRAQLGGAFDVQVDCARRAAQRFGLNEETLNTLENAVGSAALIKYLARIGESLGEEVRVDGRTESPFSLSPDEARRRVDDLLSGRDFRERYLAGDKQALDKIARLLEVGA